MISRLLRYIGLGILIALGAILVVGVFESKVILFGDTDLTYHFANKFFSPSHIYIWNDYFQSGSFDYVKFQGFFFKKFLYLIFYVVNNLYIFSYLWYFLTYFFFIFTSLIFIREFTVIIDAPRARQNTIAGILGFFSLFNGIFIIYAGQILYIHALILLNVFLLFFIKNIHSILFNKKNNFLYLAIMALMLSESLIYVQIVILAFFSLVMLATLNIRFVIENIKLLLWQAIFIIVIVLLLNMSWALPLLVKVFSSSFSYIELGKYDVDLGLKTAENVSKNVFLNELLRLKSYHVYNQIPFFLYFFGYVPFGIIVIEFIKNKTYFFSTLVLLLTISVFLSYGLHESTKWAFHFLWRYVPTFNTFRTVMKFSFIELYIVMLCLAYILSKLVNQKTFKVYTFLLVLFCTTSIAYYFRPEFKNPFQQYSIPQYYFRLSESSILSDSKLYGNKILLPQTNWMTQYLWAPKNTDSVNIFPYFSGDGNLINGAQYSLDPQYLYNDYFSKLFVIGAVDEMKKLNNFRSIKTLVFQNDIRFSNEAKDDALNRPQWSVVSKNLNDASLCESYEILGKLYLCRIQREQYTPLITTTTQSILVNNQSYIENFNEVPYILSDLAYFNKKYATQSIFFESEVGNAIKADEDLYLTMRPYVLQGCFIDGKPCNLYFGTDIPTGTYDIFFKHYPTADQLAIENTYQLEIYDSVEGQYIKEEIRNQSQKVELRVPNASNITHTFEYSTNPQSSGYVGRAGLLGSNTIIRSANNNYFTNGRFYFLKVLPSPLLEVQTPNIEYQRINPTKYSVVIHHATHQFYLNFAQNFDRGWTLVADANLPKKLLTTQGKLPAQMISTDPDQASYDELKGYIQKGILTEIPTESIKFISKEIKNTIQNENIDDESYVEYLFKTAITIPRPVSALHKSVFGYANSWQIDTKKYCSVNKCIKNADGSYDFKINIEYSPQRYLILGLAISVSVFAVLVIYIVFKTILQYRSRL